MNAYERNENLYKWYRSKDGGNKIFYPNRPGHITNMVAMPVYGKTNEKNPLLQYQLTDWLELSLCHWILKFFQDYTNDDL